MVVLPSAGSDDVAHAHATNRFGEGGKRFRDDRKIGPVVALAADIARHGRDHGYAGEVFELLDAGDPADEVLAQESEADPGAEREDE